MLQIRLYWLRSLSFIFFLPRCKITLAVINGCSEIRLIKDVAFFSRQCVSSLCFLSLYRFCWSSKKMLIFFLNSLWCRDLFKDLFKTPSLPRSSALFICLKCITLLIKLHFNLKAQHWFFLGLLKIRIQNFHLFQHFYSQLLSGIMKCMLYEEENTFPEAVMAG